MFGRRRRPVVIARRPMVGSPLLATALVVGATRSAARSEVARESQAMAQQQQLNQMASELQRRDEEERERRTQAAIEEAIAKERQRDEQIQIEASRVAVNATRAIDRVPPVYNSAPVDARALRYCGRCGNGCSMGDTFCTQCGSRLEEKN